MNHAAEQQFLLEVATFADAPAGEAMIDSDPAMVCQMLIDRAKELRLRQKRIPLQSPTSNQPMHHPDQTTR